MAMTLISRIDVANSSNLTHTFSNIPQTYVDLLAIVTGQSAGSGIDNITMYINGNSTMSNYNNILFRYTQGTGVNGAYVANSYFNTLSPGQSSYNIFSGNSITYIPNYTNSTNQKGWNTKTGLDANASNASIVGLFPTTSNITSPVTSITFSGYGLYPGAYTTISLYGIS